MAWVVLFIAGALEIAWAIGLHYTKGFTRPTASAFTLAAMAASMWLLAQAARTLPIGTAYAVWTGIGAAGTAILGIMLLKEPFQWTRIACIALIIIGIVGLKLATTSVAATTASSAPAGAAPPTTEAGNATSH